MNDQSTLTQSVIRKTVLIGAPPETVWDYLTRAENLAKWFHPAKADLAAGADYALLGDDGTQLCWGHVLEADPPRHLKYSFTARPMNGLETVVTITLTPQDSGTRLNLVHEGFAAAEGFGLMLAFDTGWDKHLIALRGVL